MRNFFLYLIMTVADLIIMAGTVYLVDQRGWSPWLFAFTLIAMTGTYPKSFLKKERYE